MHGTSIRTWEAWANQYAALPGVVDVFATDHDGTEVRSRFGGHGFSFIEAQTLLPSPDRP
jgi:hypothetical protein